jgi:hypothetical protein
MMELRENIFDVVDVIGIELIKIKSLTRAIVSLGDNQQDSEDMITLAYMAEEAAEETLQTFFDDVMGRSPREETTCPSRTARLQSLAYRYLPDTVRL